MKRVLLGTITILMLLLLPSAFVIRLIRAGAVLPIITEQTSHPTITAQREAQAVAAEYQETKAIIRFPALVEGTTLIAESLALYEGDMLENDSDIHLVDAAALELRNFGEQEVELAEIVLQVGQTEMVFFGTNIPAGSTVLIIEQDGKAWSDEDCTYCAGWIQYAEGDALPADALAMQDVDMGTVSVTNTTEEPLEDVWLFYKNYLYDSDLYLGGITYIEQIECLEPGQTILLRPSRYASGYSKIIKAVELG